MKFLIQSILYLYEILKKLSIVRRSGTWLLSYTLLKYISFKVLKVIVRWVQFATDNPINTFPLLHMYTFDVDH